MPAYGSSGFSIGTAPSCKVYPGHLYTFPSFLTVLLPSTPLLSAASQNTFHSPEASFLASLNPPSGHGSSSTPSLHASFHLPSLPSQCYDASERTAPYMVIQRGQNGSATLNQSQSKVQYDTAGNRFPPVVRIIGIVNGSVLACWCKHLCTSTASQSCRGSTFYLTWRAAHCFFMLSRDRKKKPGLLGWCIVVTVLSAKLLRPGGNKETTLIAAVDIVGGYMSVCQEITLVPTLLLLKPQSLCGLF